MMSLLSINKLCCFYQSNNLCMHGKALHFVMCDSPELSHDLSGTSCWCDWHGMISCIVQNSYVVLRFKAVVKSYETIQEMLEEMSDSFF